MTLEQSENNNLSQVIYIVGKPIKVPLTFGPHSNNKRSQVIYCIW